MGIDKSDDHKRKVADGNTLEFRTRSSEAPWLPVNGVREKKGGERNGPNRRKAPVQQRRVGDRPRNERKGSTLRTDADEALHSSAEANDGRPRAENSSPSSRFASATTKLEGKDANWTGIAELEGACEARGRSLSPVQAQEASQRSSRSIVFTGKRPPALGVP